ncbi:MAG: hypothetical protein ACUVTG_11740, partial [Candidatus Oleimicrobiaceae bacterium]
MLSRREFLTSCAGLWVTNLGLASASAMTMLAPGGRKSQGSADQGAAPWAPAHSALHRSGELRARGETLWRILERCRLCPRQCRVNRLQGARGFGPASAQLEIASFHPPLWRREAPGRTGRV